MNISRRTLAASTALIPVIAILGVSKTVRASGSVPTNTPAAIVTLAGTTATALLNAVKGIAMAEPTLIPAGTLTLIETDLTTAVAEATQLSTSLAAAEGAGLVQEINAGINATLTMLAGSPVNGLIPAPFNEVVAAAAFVAPTLESFVDTYILNASASVDQVVARALLIRLNSPIGMNQGIAASILAAHAK